MAADQPITVCKKDPANGNGGHRKLSKADVERLQAEWEERQKRKSKPLDLNEFLGLGHGMAENGTLRPQTEFAGTGSRKQLI